MKHFVLLTTLAALTACSSTGAPPSQTSPTPSPTSSPSSRPTSVPTPVRTAVPTSPPTSEPTAAPTVQPSPSPTIPPSTPSPTLAPISSPTSTPSAGSTATPVPSTPTPIPATPVPTPPATPVPTATPTIAPTVAPSPTSTPLPVPTPVTTPTATPQPTLAPTPAPTTKPTSEPTAMPTPIPTGLTVPGQSDHLSALAGADTHFNAQSPYSNSVAEPALKALLGTSGLRHIRDGGPGDLPNGVYHGAALGVDKANPAFEAGNGSFSATEASVDAQLDGTVGGPAVDYVELCGNEQDSDSHIVGAWQTMLASCVKTELGWINAHYPNGVPFPVVGPSLSDMEGHTALLAAAYAQTGVKPPYANFHPGTGALNPEALGVEAFAQANAASISTTGKYFVTEFGFSDRKNTTLVESTCGSSPCKKVTQFIYDRTNGIPESIIKAYDARSILSWYNMGASRMYFYQFSDAPVDCTFGAQGLVTADLIPTPPLGYQNDDCTGNYAFTGHITAKPEFNEVSALLHLFADYGPDFTPTPIPLAIQKSNSGNVGSAVFEKRTGDVYVALWRMENDYDWYGATACTNGKSIVNPQGYPSDNHVPGCGTTVESATVSLPGYTLASEYSFNADGTLSYPIANAQVTLSNGEPIILVYTKNGAAPSTPSPTASPAPTPTPTAKPTATPTTAPQGQFKNSVFYQPLPAQPAVAANSQTWANALFQSGRDHFPAFNTLDTGAYNLDRYTGQATMPLVISCDKVPWSAGSCGAFNGQTLAVPSDLIVQNNSDQHSIWDTPTGEMDAWLSAPIPRTGTWHIGTLGFCPFAGNGTNCSNSTATNLATSLGAIDPVALKQAEQDPVHGNLGYALAASALCADTTFVAPAVSSDGSNTNGTSACASYLGAGQRPPEGTRWFLNYTDDQVNAMGFKPYMAAIYRTLDKEHYGGIVTDTNWSGAPGLSVQYLNGDFGFASAEAGTSAAAGQVVPWAMGPIKEQTDIKFCDSGTC